MIHQLQYYPQVFTPPRRVLFIILDFLILIAILSTFTTKSRIFSPDSDPMGNLVLRDSDVHDSVRASGPPTGAAVRLFPLFWVDLFHHFNRTTRSLFWGPPPTSNCQSVQRGNYRKRNKQTNNKDGRARKIKSPKHQLGSKAWSCSSGGPASNPEGFWVAWTLVLLFFIRDS